MAFVFEPLEGLINWLKTKTITNNIAYLKNEKVSSGFGVISKTKNCFSPLQCTKTVDES